MADMTMHDRDDSRMVVLGSTHKLPLFMNYGIRPVTIHQLLQAQEHLQGLDKEPEFEIEGKLFHNLSLVAHVVDLDCETGDNIYVLEDDTGRLVGRHKEVDIDSTSDDPDGLHGVTAGIYVHVVGHLSRWRGRNTIRLMTVRPAEPSEIQHHSLQVIMATLTAERGPPPPALRGTIQDDSTSDLPPPSQWGHTANYTIRDPSTDISVLSQPQDSSMTASQPLFHNPPPSHSEADDPASSYTSPMSPMTATSETLVGSPSSSQGDLSALLSPMSISTDLPARRHPHTRPSSPSEDVWVPPSQSSTAPFLSFSSAYTSTPATGASTSASQRSSRRTPGPRRDPWDGLPVLPRKVLLWMLDHPEGHDGSGWMSLADIGRAQGLVREEQYEYLRGILVGFVRDGRMECNEEHDMYRLARGPAMYNFDLRSIQ